jgi:hypothetical protein
MRPIRLTAALLIAIVLLGAAAASGAKISRPSPVSTLPGATEAWVKAINQGNRRAACELQVVAQVGTLSCAELPTQYVLRCPKNTSVRPRTPDEIRPLSEQVRAITEEGPTRAYVQLAAQKKGSRAHGALGLELIGGSWKVTYVRQGAETFAPAGAVWMTGSWRKLWYPPTCEPSANT